MQGYPLNSASVFYFIRKLRSYEIKTLRENHTAAERKIPLMRPAAGGESCKAGFFLVHFHRKFFIMQNRNDS